MSANILIVFFSWHIVTAKGPKYCLSTEEINKNQFRRESKWVKKVLNNDIF